MREKYLREQSEAVNTVAVHRMKSLPKYLLILLLGFLFRYEPCAAFVHDPPDSITIGITIENGADLPINISMPIHGSFYIGEWTKAKTDGNGKFHIWQPWESIHW